MSERMTTDDLFIDTKSHRRKKEAIAIAQSELTKILNDISIANSHKNTVDDPSPELNELNSKRDAKRQEIHEKEIELSNLKVADSLEADNEKVNLDDKVSVHLLYSDGEEYTTTYVIVGAEPNRENREISKNTPIGKAILGKKIGDVVEVTDLPDDSLSLTITILSKL